MLLLFQGKSLVEIRLMVVFEVLRSLKLKPITEIQDIHINDDLILRKKIQFA